MKLHLKPTALSILVVFLLLAACGGSDATTTPDSAPVLTPIRTPLPGVEVATTETESYRVELWIGPMLVGMMTASPIMSSSEQGNPVNKHLEVHFIDKGTGNKLTDITPSIKLTQQETGISRELADTQESGDSQRVSFITACLISKHREWG